jgi:hypothetical protein
MSFEFGRWNQDNRTVFCDLLSFCSPREFVIFRCPPLGPLPVPDHTEAAEFYAPINFVPVQIGGLS